MPVANTSKVVLGTTAMEITREPYASNTPELLPKVQISGVYPIKINSKLVAYQVVNVGGAKAGGTATGLANNATIYTATITIDGVARAIAVTGSAAQTYTTLLAEINSDLGAFYGTASLSGGNIKITSNSINPSSTVAITDVDLFSTLTSYVAILTAVVGGEVQDWKYRFNDMIQVCIEMTDGSSFKFDLQEITGQSGWTANLAGQNQCVSDINAWL